MKYIKIPIEVEAVKFPFHEYADNPLSFDEVPKWLEEAFATDQLSAVFKTEDYWYLEAKTLEGTMLVRPGDWIIRGVEGEIYPCKDTIFKATYRKP